ncbi:MAG: sigma 54-interacting transcriptional regulator [Polyangiaceae bacterium]|nr:sigma 54-interacting transcriptional regulator [Polyangiaceae bacterium]
MADRSEAEETYEAGPEQPRGYPRLVALWDGGGASSPLPQSGSVIVGRNRDAGVVLDHGSVSRKHARLEIREDGVVWEDLESANGVRIRGRKLAPSERVAVSWDEPVEVGLTIVVVRSPSTERASLPPSESPMVQVEQWIRLVAGTDMPVLLLGETGVGKGYFARTIHDRSARASGPFVHINCAAIPDNLLESELFGHERGAFTGAAQAKIGLLESASGGTVFLDEVGDLPLSAQSKLLVALERREVMRVGALQPRPFDVRLISATNRSIEGDAAGGRFRQDLYYRLAGLPIRIPSLRDRQDEIRALASRFVVEAARRLRRTEPALSEGALRALVRHSWPGNVRELITVIDRAMLHAPSVIGEEHIALAMGPIASSAPAAQTISTRASDPSDGGETGERERILAALDACAGNQSRAAKMLGIARRTLINRIEQYGLPRPRK